MFEIFAIQTRDKNYRHKKTPNKVMFEAKLA